MTGVIDRAVQFVFPDDRDLFARSLADATRVMVAGIVVAAVVDLFVNTEFAIRTNTALATLLILFILVALGVAFLLGTLFYVIEYDAPNPEVELAEEETGS